jgi:CBS domain-containing protein
VTHLPVADNELFLGLLSEDELLQAEDANGTIQELIPTVGNLSVKMSDHFLKALQLAAENDLSVVPITDNENHFVGAITYADLLKQAAGFMSLNAPGALIVLEMDSNQYSFNEISKLVETNDAQITQLNTSNDPETGVMQVTIRVNKPEVSDIVATFQRYEYNVKYYFGEEIYTNELRDNYENLMNYLRI